MHILLTDKLTCSRCGPTFGLILLADRIDERMVLEGRLGCPNCRDSYVIHGGFADLRAPPREEPPAGLAGAPPRPEDVDEDARRVAALLGVVEGPGTIALVGEPARYASAQAIAADGIHVAAVDPDLRTWPERAEVSRLMSAPGLPFFSSTLRGVAVDGRLGSEWLEESARVVVPGGRVVVVHAPAEANETLVRAGLTVLASEAETVVAARG